MSTASGVWEPDIAKYGAMAGDLLAVRSPGSGWDCYDLKQDPRQHARAKDLGCLKLFFVGSVQAFGEASR
jgi:hypothetical protein